MDVKEIREMLIEAQNNLLKMVEDAKREKHKWEFDMNTKPEIYQKDYNTGFYGGSIQSLEYASKHITNILKKSE